MRRARIVEDCLILSLHHVLREHRRGRSAVFVLDVSLDPDRPGVRVRVERGEQAVPLHHASHNLSGTRWWFLCDCGERSFTLYRPIEAARYRCRMCYALRYRSENLSRAGRLEYRATKLAKRMGGSLLREPTRIKRMRHATFARRRADADAANLRAGLRRLSTGWGRLRLAS